MTSNTGAELTIIGGKKNKEAVKCKQILTVFLVKKRMSGNNVNWYKIV